jgi:hypothetical protein
MDDISRLPRGRLARGFMPKLVARLALVALCATAIAGCKARHNSRGELSPPDDAPAWEERFGFAFDDDYTDAELELRGRAPHDVLDQKLFGARIGYSAIVALVQVEQVWGRGRYQGKHAQYIDVELGDVLFGELPKGTRTSQMLRLRGEDDTPADLQGKQLVLFLRWAPGNDPAYHHHLMPANDDIVAYIRALVAHARQEGALDTGRRGKRKARRRGAEVEASGSVESDPADGAPPE